MENNITRQTKQRKMIIEVFMENQGRHLTPDEMFALVREKDSNIGIATVYRNLKLLDEQGVIKKLLIDEGGGSAFYELQTHGEIHSHHHLICKKCGSVSDFQDDLLDAIEKIIEITSHFEIHDHKVSFYGICMNCRGEK